MLKKLPNGYWDSNLYLAFQRAKEYNYKSDFRLNSGSEYHALKKRGRLQEACSHMEHKSSKLIRVVYSIEFTRLNKVYIGLTWDLDKRMSSHKSTSHNKYLRELIKDNEFTVKVHCPPMPQEEAAIKEGEVKTYYESSGWETLNIARAGGLGGKRRFLTKEKSREVLKELYGTSIKDLRTKHSELYKVVTKFEDWKELKKNFLYKRLDYSMEFLIEQFSKFPSGYAMKSDRIAHNAYHYAHRNGLLNEFKKYHYIKDTTRVKLVWADKKNGRGTNR